MFESDSTTSQLDTREFLYYEEWKKHIDPLSKKFQEKSLIKQNVYNDIVKCLLSTKEKPLGLFSSKYTYWVKRHFGCIDLFLVKFQFCLKTEWSKLEF